MPLRLVFQNLLAHPVRVFLTVGSMVIAFFLLCFLRTVIVGLEAGVKGADDSRLMVQSAVSLFVNLPISYQGKIESVDGVENTCKLQWFGGIYQDPSNFFAQFAVDHDRFFDVYREVELIEGSREAFETKRTACVVGADLAKRYGWKIGDTIPILGTIFPRNDGRPWAFELVGIYHSTSANVDQLTMWFHYDYLQETLEAGSTSGPPGVGVFVVDLEPGAQVEAVSARIDDLFKGGPQRVQTTTEAEFQRQFVTMLGSVPTFLGSIGGGVLFAILLAVTNTMLMAARERTRELGILKALGFSNDVAFALLLGESLLLALVGGGVGIGLALLSEPVISGALSALFPNYHVTGDTVRLGAGLALIIGLVAGIVPAWQASRLDVVEALRAEV